MQSSEDDELYVLFLLGMLRRQEVRPDKEFGPAFTVFGALSEMDCYPELVKRKWTQESGLRNRIQVNALRITRGLSKPYRRHEVQQDAEAADGKHLIMAAAEPKSGLSGIQDDMRRVIGMAGYPLLLLPAGERLATVAAKRYPELTSKAYRTGLERFLALPRAAYTI